MTVHGEVTCPALIPAPRRIAWIPRCFAGPSRAPPIGNAVEWFDFAIYGFLATYIAGQFLPVRKRNRRAAEHFRDLRGGVLHATARRLLLRAAGGPHRAAARARDRDPADVGLDVRDRAAADLPDDRRRRAAAAAVPPLPARLFGGRRIRQRRLLPRRVRARQAPRLHRLVPGVVRGRRLPARIGDRHGAAGDAVRGGHGLLRLAHPLPAGRRAGPGRPVHPAAPVRHPRVREAARRRGSGDVAAEGGAHHRVAADPADLRPGRHPQRRLLRRVHLPADATSPRRWTSPRPTRSSRSPWPAWSRSS